MLTTPPELARPLVRQLLDALRAIPGIDVKISADDVEHSSPTSASDAVIEIRVAGTPITLLLETRKALYPRDVREALWRTRESPLGPTVTHVAGNSIPMLVADSISPGAKDLLRAERVGYYDSGGSLYVPAGGVLLYVDKPPPKPLAKSIRSLFTGRRAQVVHALLLGHREWFAGKDLAARAQVSAATASQVLGEMERLDWITARGQGPHKERRVSEPGALLDQWVQALASQRAPLLHRYFLPAVNLDHLLDPIARAFAVHEVSYAISNEAAAQCYAPFLTSVPQVKCRLLPGPAAAAAMQELGARVVTEGANLAVIEVKSPGELLFRERLGDYWLASPIQVYLDLQRGEGRSKELAAHLRKEKLGY